MRVSIEQEVLLTAEQLAIDEGWMREALQLAEASASDGEVPVGAVVVSNGERIGAGRNAPIGRCDPSAHAEIQAIRAACAQESNYRLPGATLYVTIEPCTMCVGAIVHARIARVVFGAREPKAGAVVSQNNLFTHQSMNTQVSYAEGILEQECRQMMTAFFSERRARKKQLRQSALAKDTQEGRSR